MPGLPSTTGVVALPTTIDAERWEGNPTRSTKPASADGFCSRCLHPKFSQRMLFSSQSIVAAKFCRRSVFGDHCSLSIKGLLAATKVRTTTVLAAIIVE